MILGRCVKRNMAGQDFAGPDAAFCSEPADGTAPFFNFSLSCRVTGRRYGSFTVSGFPDLPDLVVQWRQSYFSSACIHSLRLFELPGTHLSILIPVENGAVYLWLSFIEADAVQKKSFVACGRIPGADSRAISARHFL